ncbi:MAG: rhodanese-like domain-containing protein [Clostridiales bacterium]|nr:rhodanese-like domain-containing protein [Clostridiales bacterium]
MEVKKLVRETGVIVVACILLGAAVNFSLVRRFFAGEFREAYIDREKYAGLRFITLAEAGDLFARGLAVFIDSRMRGDFVSGHIPGALSLPLDEVKDPADVGERLKQGPLSLSAEKTLVVYCEGEDCQTSVALAKLIHGQGFRDIRVLMGGWAEWRAAGLPVEESP